MLFIDITKLLSAKSAALPRLDKNSRNVQTFLYTSRNVQCVQFALHRVQKTCSYILYSSRRCDVAYLVPIRDIHHRLISEYYED